MTNKTQDVQPHKYEPADYLAGKSECLHCAETMSHSNHAGFVRDYDARERDAQLPPSPTCPFCGIMPEIVGEGTLQMPFMAAHGRSPLVKQGSPEHRCILDDLTVTLEAWSHRAEAASRSSVRQQAATQSRPICGSGNTEQRDSMKYCNDCGNLSPQVNRTENLHPLYLAAQSALAYFHQGTDSENYPPNLVIGELQAAVDAYRVEGGQAHRYANVESRANELARTICRMGNGPYELHHSRVKQLLMEFIQQYAALVVASTAPIEAEQLTCAECGHSDALDPNGECMHVERDAGGSLVYCHCRCDFSRPVSDECALCPQIPSHLIHDVDGGHLLAHEFRPRDAAPSTIVESEICDEGVNP